MFFGFPGIKRKNSGRERIEPLASAWSSSV
jgi:hypothetical protein